MPPFREGFALVLGNRELRSLAILPMVLGFFAFIFIYALAVWLLGGWVAHLIGTGISRLGGFRRPSIWAVPPASRPPFGST